MKTYILIMILSNSNGLSSTSAEFSSKEACLAAKRAMESTKINVVYKYDPNKTIWCFRK